jgi:hypothetical protein
MSFSELIRRLREPQLVDRRLTVRERGYCFAWEVWAYAALGSVIGLDDANEPVILDRKGDSSVVLVPRSGGLAERPILRALTAMDMAHGAYAICLGIRPIWPDPRTPRSDYIHGPDAMLLHVLALKEEAGRRWTAGVPGEYQRISVTFSFELIGLLHDHSHYTPAAIALEFLTDLLAGRFADLGFCVALVVRELAGIAAWLPELGSVPRVLTASMPPESRAAWCPDLADAPAAPAFLRRRRLVSRRPGASHVLPTGRAHLVHAGRAVAFRALYLDNDETRAAAAGRVGDR